MLIIFILAQKRKNFLETKEDELKYKFVRNKLKQVNERKEYKWVQGTGVTSSNKYKFNGSRREA